MYVVYVDNWLLRFFLGGGGSVTLVTSKLCQGLQSVCIWFTLPEFQGNGICQHGAKRVL